MELRVCAPDAKRRAHPPPRMADPVAANRPYYYRTLPDSLPAQRELRNRVTAHLVRDQPLRCHTNIPATGASRRGGSGGRGWGRFSTYTTTQTVRSFQKRVLISGNDAGFRVENLRGGRADRPDGRCGGGGERAGELHRGQDFDAL